MASLNQIRGVLKWINGFRLFKLKYNGKVVGGIERAKYYTRNDVLVITLINNQDKIVITSAMSYTYYTPNGLMMVIENDNYHKELEIAGLYNIFG